MTAHAITVLPEPGRGDQKPEVVREQGIDRGLLGGLKSEIRGEFLSGAHGTAIVALDLAPGSSMSLVAVSSRPRGRTR